MYTQHAGCVLFFSQRPPSRRSYLPSDMHKFFEDCPNAATFLFRQGCADFRYGRIANLNRSQGLT